MKKYSCNWCGHRNDENKDRFFVTDDRMTICEKCIDLAQSVLADHRAKIEAPQDREGNHE